MRSKLPSDRDETRARAAVQRAVARGKTSPQPCEECGNPHAEAHHEDYSQPLNVRWLCKLHHEEK